MEVHPTLVRVLIQRSLAPSVTSVTSVGYDKGVNDMIPGALHRSPGTCLAAEGNLGKPQLGDRHMKAVRPVSASNGVLCLQMGSVGSNSTLGRDNEGKMDRVRIFLFIISTMLSKFHRLLSAKFCL